MIIAVSGYPGSGKTSLCKLLSENDNFISFELGILFRSLLMFCKDNSIDINCFSEKKIYNNLNISYLINSENQMEFIIDGFRFEFDKLFNLKMNMETVKFGGLIGDDMNKNIEKIIKEIADEYNLILNVRKPFSVYPELDLHIFLIADFLTRSKRKAELNNISLVEAMKKLKERDIMEKNNDFLEVRDNSKIINTTTSDVNDTYIKVKKLIRRL